ncbi:MAG: hypothetical protein KF820_01110 [Candidatus Paracaedibacteraceae bacterium]|nr:hypothetical protein [Candidatus Paracaedibacteraceae bacterium]
MMCLVHMAIHRKDRNVFAALFPRSQSYQEKMGSSKKLRRTTGLSLEQLFLTTDL